MGVELHQVGWRCPGDGRWWLRGLEARAPVRGTLGLECDRAWVRGLLCDLLGGVRRPTTGRVRVAGVDLEGLDADSLAHWRRTRLRCTHHGDGRRLTVDQIRRTWSPAPELLLLLDPLEIREPRDRSRVRELLRWMRGQRRCTTVLVGGALPPEACDALVRL